MLQWLASYAAVLWHCNRERLRRERDRALERHPSPKACMVEEQKAAAYHGYSGTNSKRQDQWC